MTKLDELVSFILSDELKEVRNYNCYDRLVVEAKRYQREQVENIAYEPVLATVLDYPNTVKLCKPNYLAKDGSIKEAERFVDQKNEQIIYYCHKDDMYCG